MYCQIYSCSTIFCALIIIQFLFEVIYVWKIEDFIRNIMFSAVFKELTNLIIIRNCSSVEAPGSPTTERNKFSHIQFHMIKYEDLSCVSWSACCANPVGTSDDCQYKTSSTCFLLFPSTPFLVKAEQEH